MLILLVNAAEVDAKAALTPAMRASSVTDVPALAKVPLARIELIEVMASLLTVMAEALTVMAEALAAIDVCAKPICVALI